MNKMPLSNKEKLSNIKFHAEEVLRHGFKDRYTIHPIFTFIKILTDKITANYAAETITEPINERKVYGECFDIKNLMYSNVNCVVCKERSDKDISVNLCTCPLILSPWNSSKICNLNISIGSSNNPWKYDIINHRLDLYYPLGVFVTYGGGNHSTLIGKLKGKATMPLTRYRILDLTPLYNEIQFDGENYIDRKNGEIIEKALNFEFGCIFEIGSLILEYEVYFKGIKI